jgi:DNA integrity scanning protein DisA with diadenylate cyclase activity
MILGKQFAMLYDLAVGLARATEAEAILVFVEGIADWDRVVERAANYKTLVAVETPEQHVLARESGLLAVLVQMPEAPVTEKLTQALLECVAEEYLAQGAVAVALFSGFSDEKVDSISLLQLKENLGRLTARDLRQLETSVPLETLREVVDLAVEIGREGREGKPVGTMFVVGDSRKVLSQCHEAGFDPVKGYSRDQRNLHDPRIRESLKEVAQLDGAFIVNSDGIVERAAQLIDTSPVSLTLSKGLGSRHWAAAAISKNTRAIAIVVSESTGTVRIFQNGEVVLRIEPFRRAMKWKGSDGYEPPIDGE